MKSYTEIKQALQRETSANLRYFTKSFLATYAAALKTIDENTKNGIDDGYYTDDGIYTRHAFDAVRKTDFYNKSSGAYCQFLEIVH